MYQDVNLLPLQNKDLSTPTKVCPSTALIKVTYRSGENDEHSQRALVIRVRSQPLDEVPKKKGGDLS